MKIGEAAAASGCHLETIRYYERIGLIPEVNRNKSGIRDYTEENCRWVEFAKCMRGAGLQVEALIEYVALFQQGELTREARKQIILEQRKQLAERIEAMQKTLDRLDDKIERYEQSIVKAEKNLI